MATGSRLTSRTAAEAESSGACDRLPEERRTKIADRVAKIRVIEKVQDVYRDRQVITAVRRASASEVSAAATTTSTSTAASATTATCATTSTTSCALRSACSSCVRLFAEAEITARA